MYEDALPILLGAADAPVLADHPSQPHTLEPTPDPCNGRFRRMPAIKARVVRSTSRAIWRRYSKETVIRRRTRTGLGSRVAPRLQHYDHRVQDNVIDCAASRERPRSA